MWLPVPQVIFITEYMSSGSLKQFLKKTKKNHKTMNEKVMAACMDTSIDWIMIFPIMKILLYMTHIPLSQHRQEPARVRTTDLINTFIVSWLSAREFAVKKFWAKLNHIVSKLLYIGNQLASILIRRVVLQAWKRWCTQILSALRLVSLLQAC